MATTTQALDDFLALSEALTGFTAANLQGTGLVAAHYNTVRDIVGERIFGFLLLTWRKIPKPPGGSAKTIASAVRKKILANALLGPVARNIILLWYVGTWYQMPGPWRVVYGASALDLKRVVSAQAYQEGLMWRAVDAHPPAAKAPGFGTWTVPPGGEPDTIRDNWQTTPPSAARPATSTPAHASRRPRRLAARAAGRS